MPADEDSFLMALHHLSRVVGYLVDGTPIEALVILVDTEKGFVGVAGPTDLKLAEEMFDKGRARLGGIVALTKNQGGN